MTEHSKKTKGQLIQELEGALGKIAGLETREAELKRTEEIVSLMQFSVDRMADAAFWMGPDARLIYVNEAACSSLGYSKEELLSMAVHDIDPNFPAEAWPGHWKEVKERGSFSLESLHRTKDGQVFPVEITVNYLEFGGREYNCAFARDITARKLAEQELRTSEEKYRQLVQLSNDAIYILYNRKFELINEKFKEMFNVTLEYVISPEFDFMELVAPKSRAYIEERNQKMAKGEKLSPHYSFTALSMDKREIELEASVTYIKYKEGTAVQGILRDVSERKNIEERLRQSQKLEAIGTLAGGIAHDFNNILMGIQGRTSLMLMQGNLPPSIIEHLNGIEKYVKSATDLTQQLLGFARGGKYEVKPIDINTLIRRTAGMFGRTRKEIKIQEKYQEDIWTVEVDIGQVEQVFLNLFVNAWQAMPGGGVLYIQTENVELDESYTHAFQTNPGGYVKISVTDTGVGMDEATRVRIFEPFFTTRKMGRGTGLGLATVYGILKNHGGFINVYSEKGQGTTFNIYLPVSEKLPQEETPPMEMVRKGSGTILIVDDEEIIIEVGVPLLENLGYQVLTASSGKEALEIYQSCREQIDLVILDMIMPDIGGGETYDRLKKMDPQVKVLLSSGYSLNGQAADILSRGCNGFIQKPFDIKQLSQKLMDILADK